MKWKDKMIRFMSGRYGIDALWYFLIGLYLVLLVAEVIVSMTAKGLAGTIAVIVLNVLMWATVILAVYRGFSRNIYRRSAENRKFLAVWQPIRNFFVLQKNKIRDRKTHVYRTCPDASCKAVLRLPKKEGMHRVRCPKCGKSFDVKI